MSLIKIKNKLVMMVGLAVLLCVFTVFMGLTKSTTAHAEFDSKVSAVKISPLRSDITIEPGKSKVVPVTVTNVSKSKIELQVVENDFTSIDDNGSPAVILDSNSYASTHSLKRYMKPIKSVTIAPGKSKTVKQVISVPEDAQAGGYFGAVRFIPKSLATSGQVNMSSSVASLILMKVPGDVVEKLAVKDFSIHKGDDLFGSGFFWDPSGLELKLRVENKGNVQLSPHGKISVKKGKTVLYESDFNTDQPKDTVLPDGARKWSVSLGELGNFGRYTVSMALGYGDKNETVNLTKSFWIVPKNAVFIAGISLVVVIILIFIVIIVRIEHKKHRKKVRFSKKK